jgi:hypothetical protein
MIDRSLPVEGAAVAVEEVQTAQQHERVRMR